MKITLDLLKLSQFIVILLLDFLKTSSLNLFSLHILLGRQLLLKAGVFGLNPLSQVFQINEIN